MFLYVLSAWKEEISKNPTIIKTKSAILFIAKILCLITEDAWYRFSYPKH